MHSVTAGSIANSDDRVHQLAGDAAHGQGQRGRPSPGAEPSIDRGERAADRADQDAPVVGALPRHAGRPQLESSEAGRPALGQRAPSPTASAPASRTRGPNAGPDTGQQGRKPPSCRAAAPPISGVLSSTHDGQPPYYGRLSSDVSSVYVCLERYC